MYANTKYDNPSSNEIYHDITESTTDEDTVAVYSSVDAENKNGNSKQMAVVFAKPQKDVGKTSVPIDSQEESLYYASANRQDPEGQEGNVGWEDNAAYSSYADDVQSEGEGENQDGGDTEGWEDNSLYATKEDDEDTSEWVDNDIYAGSDEESQ